MIEELIKQPEVIKALMQMGAGFMCLMFTIYLLIKLIEKLIMKGRHDKRAEQYYREMKDMVERAVEKDKE